MAPEEDEFGLSSGDEDDLIALVEDGPNAATGTKRKAEDEGDEGAAAKKVAMGAAYKCAVTALKKSFGFNAFQLKVSFLLSDFTLIESNRDKF